MITSFLEIYSNFLLSFELTFFPFKLTAVRGDHSCESTRRTAVSKLNVGLEVKFDWYPWAARCWLGLHPYSEVCPEVLWLICSSCLGHYFGVLFICSGDAANRKSFPFCCLKALLVISKTSMPLIWRETGKAAEESIVRNHFGKRSGITEKSWTYVVPSPALFS